MAGTFWDWQRGDAETIAEVVRWLRSARAFRRAPADPPGPQELRAAVALQQKRWGDSPTGHLTAEQWDRLKTEHDTKEKD